MWCCHCKQETPGLGPPTLYGLRCARCQRTGQSTSPPSGEACAQHDGPSPTEKLRQISRTLRTAQSTASAGPASHTFRFDTAALGVADSLTTANGTTRSASPSAAKFRPRPVADRSKPKRPPSRFGQVTGWALAAIGSAALGLGFGLLGWSTLGDRPDLWNLALATAAFGQGLVIIGLVQLLANLWTASRQSHTKLAQMHEDLRRVRRTTEQAAGQHTPTASAFYSGLAANAGPDVLVGNLRGQLDQLSAHLRVD